MTPSGSDSRTSLAQLYDVYAELDRSSTPAMPAMPRVTSVTSLDSPRTGFFPSGSVQHGLIPIAPAPIPSAGASTNGFTLQNHHPHHYESNNTTKKLHGDPNLKEKRPRKRNAVSLLSYTVP